MSDKSQQFARLAERLWTEAETASHGDPQRLKRRLMAGVAYLEYVHTLHGLGLTPGPTQEVEVRRAAKPRPAPPPQSRPAEPARRPIQRANPADAPLSAAAQDAVTIMQSLGERRAVAEKYVRRVVGFCRDETPEIMRRAYAAKSGNGAQDSQQDGQSTIGTNTESK